MRFPAEPIGNRFNTHQLNQSIVYLPLAPAIASPASGSACMKRFVQAGNSPQQFRDPGTGKTYGFYMEKNAAAKQIFDAWLAPLTDLGVRRNVTEGIGSTDHVPFVQAGVPAFTTIKDFENYDVRTSYKSAR